MVKVANKVNSDKYFETEGVHYITCDRHDRIVGQFLFEGKRFIVLDVTGRWFRFNFFYSVTCV
jgi:hypothetical protein